MAANSGTATATDATVRVLSQVPDYELAAVRAGHVCPDGEDVAWIVADLAPLLAGVPVLRVDATTLSVGPADVAGVEVTLLVDGVDHARRVATMLELGGTPQETTPEGWAWWVRVAWRGWLHLASRRFPVALEIVARAARPEGPGVDASTTAHPGQG